MLAATFMGAEGAYEDYVFLQMLQREWERPIVEFDTFSESLYDLTALMATLAKASASNMLIFWLSL